MGTALTLEFDALKVRVFAPDARCPLVWLHLDGDEQNEWQILQTELESAHVSLAAISGADWGRDFTPWPSTARLRGKTYFPGGADAHLDRLEGRVFDQTIQAARLEPVCQGIAGYSLAGLFALYAATRSKRFRAAASVSGSMWYEGFTDYVTRADCLPEAAYLSVGDRESGGRGVFAKVEVCTREVEQALRLRGVETIFETNPGGHFDEPTLRLAKGISWIAERLSRQPC